MSESRDFAAYEHAWLPPEKFSYCPDCMKKGVSFRLRANGEDNYQCRYCHWYFFTASPMAKRDREEQARWEAMQCDVDECTRRAQYIIDGFKLCSGHREPFIEENA